MSSRLKTRVVGGCVFVLLMGAAMASEAAQGIEKKPFGRLADGTAIDLYTLTNAKGGEVAIMTLGGVVVSLKVPDRAGKLGDVVTGFGSLDGYVKGCPYFGAVVGRYGNRIAKGKFTLNGTTYSLATNNGPNHLHGGLRGFDKVVWQAKPNNVRRRPGTRADATSARTARRAIPGRSASRSPTPGPMPTSCASTTPRLPTRIRSST